MLLLAVFPVERWGRKPLLISGSIGMAIGAFGVALCNLVPGLVPILSVGSIMVYSESFMFSWGPICWVLIAEIFPTPYVVLLWPWLWHSNGFSISLSLPLSCPCTTCVWARWATSLATCLPMPSMASSASSQPCLSGNLFPKQRGRRLRT